MASKFQNRLVGTIILVAVGVIVLPGLLDGKKKRYEDDFAAIPLVPKPGDSLETESMPPINQSLPTQPPEGAQAAQNSAAANVTPDDADVSAPAQETPPAKAAAREPVKAAPKPEVKAKPEIKPKPEMKPVKAEPKSEARLAESQAAEAKAAAAKAAAAKAAEAKAIAAKAAEAKEAQAKAAAAKAAEPKPTEQAPAGQAFVVQLGALKNADRVTEIVAKLRQAGYRAYSVPSTPVAGEINRIYVGPDASKQKLQDSLGQLQQVSGLSGQVQSYKAR